MKQWLREHRWLIVGGTGWTYVAFAIFWVLWSSASGWMWVLPVLGTLWLIGLGCFMAYINGPASEEAEREMKLAELNEARELRAASRYDDPDRIYGAPW